MVSDDLNEIAERERAAGKPYTIRCCLAAGCMSSSSQGVKEALQTAVQEAGLQDEVEVRGVSCMKLCCQGPLVQIDSKESGATIGIEGAAPGVLYQKVTAEDAASVVATIRGGDTQEQRRATSHPLFYTQISYNFVYILHISSITIHE